MPLPLEIENKITPMHLIAQLKFPAVRNLLCKSFAYTPIPLYAEGVIAEGEGVRHRKP